MTWRSACYYKNEFSRAQPQTIAGALVLWASPAPCRDANRAFVFKDFTSNQAVGDDLQFAAPPRQIEKGLCR